MPGEGGSVERVTLSVHRSVVVLGTNDRPAFELTNTNGEVTMVKRSRSGEKVAVRYDDLAAAITQLAGAEPR